MKIHNLISAKLSLSLLLASSLFVGCQKPSINLAPTKKIVLLDAEKQVPAVACSAEMRHINDQFTSTQAAAKKADENLKKDPANAELNNSYKKISVQLAENCKLLRDQFTVDKVDSCITSDNNATRDNQIYQSTIENVCKPVTDWFNKMINAENSAQTQKKEAALVLQFNETSKSLLQSKDSNDLAYVVGRTIKNGREQFKQDILSGNTTCAFQTSADSSKDETQFSTISEIPGSSINLGFDFKGSLFSLALEDSKKMMLSMTCYNMTIGSGVSKREQLQKVFGSLILIQDKIVVTDAGGTTDATPAVQATGSETSAAEEVKSGSDEKQKKSEAAVDAIVEKAKETMHEVVKDTLAEVKATSDQVRAETIVEAKKAAQEVADETIIKATAAAKEVSKVAVQEAKVAANEVVAQSVVTVKKAAADTIKAPFVYVAKKAVEAKDAVVATTKKAVNYVEDKAITVKNYVSSAWSSKDYWSSFFASQGQ